MITQPKVPFSLKDITVDWFTTTLRESGIIDDEKVVSFTHNVIGQEAGFNGEVAIFKLEYSDPASSAPNSMVLKIPTALKNRTLGQTMGLYEKEIRFYLLKRVQDEFESLDKQQQEDVTSLLDACDMTGLLKTTLSREIGRLNNLEVWL